VRHALGVEGASHASGVVVVVDVLRAFTVSAYALAGGARECLLVRTVEEARTLASSTAGAVVSAEVDTLPVEGIAISNSPTQVAVHPLTGRSLIQRTSAGTQAIAAVGEVEAIYAASLVVARATAQACLLRAPRLVTLVASGDFPESCLTCSRTDLGSELRPLYDSKRYQAFAKGDWPGFPKRDLDLALEPDRFRFAMPATRQADHFRLVREELQA